MQRVSAVLGSALFFVVAPCVLAGLIPWSMTRWEFGPAFFGLELTRAVGVLLILVGLPGLVDSFARFALQGLGTPAPVAPTKNLVVTGLYRYVRNPIYVAVVAIILGQAMLFGDWRLIVYGALLWLAFHVFVVAYEEPTLEQTFGARVRGISRERPALGSAGGPLESTGVWLATARKEMRSDGCVPCGKFRQVWARLAWKTRSGNVRPWDPRRTISIDKPHSRSLSLIPRTSGRALADQVIE